MIIINVARGPIINESDLVELLNTGHVQSVGLDVFEKEPLVNKNLLNFNQNLYGSHNGSNTIEAVNKTSKIAINKINSFLLNKNILK